MVVVAGALPGRSMLKCYDGGGGGGCGGSVRHGTAGRGDAGRQSRAAGASPSRGGCSVICINGPSTPSAGEQSVTGAVTCSRGSGRVRLLLLLLLPCSSD